MQTPWGEIAVADAHVHFFSSRFFSLLAPGMTDVAARLGWQAPPEDAAGLARVWVEELDRHGVSEAVLIATMPGDAVSVTQAVAAAPTRFHGYCMMNPTAQPAEISPGMKGICLFPAMHRYGINDAAVVPFLELADRERLVVFVHCGVLTVGIRKKLGLPSPFDMRYSNPIDLHPAALAYPRVNFVIPHFGAGYFREALMVADLCPNVYLDTSSSNNWMRYSGLDLKEVFRRALAVAGPQRLLFGTDSSYLPRGWNREIFDRQVKSLQELGITAEDAAEIFGGNLRRLMNGCTA
jgi:predicted TIM-barrel fold metal-dependent hydrolase